MKRIARHAIEWQEVEFMYAPAVEDLPDAVASVTKNPRNLSMVADQARTLAALESVRDPKSRAVVGNLRITAHAAAAVFALAEAPGGTVNVLIGNQQFTLPATGPHDGSHVVRWLEGFFTATITRDAYALEILRRTPVELVRRSSTRTDECQYLYMDALSRLHLNEPGVAERLRDAVRATDPAAITIDEEYVLQILVAQMEIVFAYLQRDQDKYNAALTTALERHKHYWTRKRDERRTDPDGFLALGPLALACICFEHDMPPGVESDYIPSALIFGDHA